MKDLIKNVYVSVIFLSLTMSCGDFLATPPVDRLTSDGFYQTPLQSEQGIIGIYADLRYLSDDDFLFMSEFRSDNIWINPQPEGFREYSEISTFRGGSDISTYNNAWNRWYKVIYDANVAINKIVDCDFSSRDAFKNQLLGEAYFLRGWAYFELTRLFGNIPVVDAPMSPNEVLDIKQSPSIEVYDKIIIPDLQKAKDMLPLDENMTNASNSKISGSGRADKIAAQAMLARVYMTKAGYPVNDSSSAMLAKTELKSVIDFSEAHGNKFWAADSIEWQKQWISEYNNKYSIFAIQYRSGGTGNPAIWNVGARVPPSYTSLPVYNAKTDICVEKSLMSEFEKIYSNGNRDARGIDHSVLLGYDEEPNWPARVPQSEPLEPGSQIVAYTNSMFYKYLNTTKKRIALGFTDNIETEMKDARDWPVNYPVIRLEDLLLMYAELLANEGLIKDPLDIVNRIRLRAGCDAVEATSSGEVLSYVKRERRVELMGEGIRWFDLVRWNEWKTAITSMFDRYNNPAGAVKSNIRDGRYLYPIPLSQLNVKPGLYIQNGDY
ncbi:MAG: RagB/SusD family nutrient uptake outer membrane protein [Tannerella sp.]|jgi:hypothetical protein|nr:RagB/SusD family nutrient uptake outer membrane protein [Tannerella sp.]